MTLFPRYIRLLSLLITAFASKVEMLLFYYLIFKTISSFKYIIYYIIITRQAELLLTITACSAPPTANWHCLDGNCFLVSYKAYTWTFANNDDCWSYYKGRLAIVDTQAKHDFLLSKGLIGTGK